MATTGGKKKGRKEKGKTVDLQTFLTGDKNAPEGFAFKSTNWADQMEEEDIPNFSSITLREPVALPTAPKAARSEIDANNVPTSPPYKLHIGNIPYETTEEEIKEFFRDFNLKEVTLPKEDHGSRLRGFGYAEFNDRESLVEALSITNTSLNGRSLRLSLPGEQEDGRPGRGMRDERDDRTANDWRSGPRETSNKPDYNSRNNGGSSFGAPRDDREFSRADFGQDKRGGNDRNDFDRRATYGRFEDRENRDNRRDYDSRDNRSGFERRDGGGGGYGRREGGGFPPREERRYDSERGGGFGARRPEGGSYEPRRTEYSENRYEGNTNSASSGTSGPPKERPKLVLKPRTVPIDDVSKPASASAIFGGAKPVDTAKKEQEVEAKLHAKFDKPKEGESERIRRISSSSTTSGRSRKVSESTQEEPVAAVYKAPVGGDRRRNFDNQESRQERPYNRDNRDNRDNRGYGQNYDRDRRDRYPENRSGSNYNNRSDNRYPDQSRNKRPAYNKEKAHSNNYSGGRPTESIQEPAYTSSNKYDLLPVEDE